MMAYKKLHLFNYTEGKKEQFFFTAHLITKCYVHDTNTKSFLPNSIELRESLERELKLQLETA